MMTPPTPQDIAAAIRALLGPRPLDATDEQWLNYLASCEEAIRAGSWQARSDIAGHRAQVIAGWRRDGATLAQIGRRLGVTAERARQLAKRGTNP